MKVNPINFVNRRTVSNKANKINKANLNLGFVSNPAKLNSPLSDSVHFSSRYTPAPGQSPFFPEEYMIYEPDEEEKKPKPTTDWTDDLEKRFQRRREIDPYRWAMEYDPIERYKYYQYLFDMIDYKPSFFKATDLQKKLELGNNFVIELMQAYTYIRAAEECGRVPYTDTKLSKETREKYIKNLAMQEQYDFLNKRITNPDGSFADKIAGYDAQVSRIKNGFVRYVDLERYNRSVYFKMCTCRDRYSRDELKEAFSNVKNVPIPPSILIYGPNNVGKDSFVGAMANETGAKVVRYSPLSGQTIDDFLENDVYKSLYDSSYKGQRTIHVIDEPERYFYLSDDPKVKARVEKLKMHLKACSHSSFYTDDDGYSGYALTFVFTTENPSKLKGIGLIEDEEKMPIIISLPPAEKANLEEVIKFNLKRITPKDGRFLLEDYDYSKILKKLSPSERGAYSNEKIKCIFDEVVDDYIARRNVPFRVCLEEGIINEKCKSVRHRDISPSDIAKYQRNLEEVGER